MEDRVIEGSVARRVHVEWAILADFTEVVNGKLYLMGGGWDTIVSDRPLPFTRSVGIALAVQVPWGETNQPHRVAVEIQDEDGRVLAKIDANIEVGRPPGLPAGASQRVQLAVNAVLGFEKAGTFVIAPSINGHPDARTSFRVAGRPAK